jgi:hypothetical protein
LQARAEVLGTAILDPPGGQAALARALRRLVNEHEELEHLRSRALAVARGSPER